MATTYAALLRGINVGGSRKVPMAELRTLMEGLGHDAVRTHLQSGQAVFTTGSDRPEGENGGENGGEGADAIAIATETHWPPNSPTPSSGTSASPST